MHGVLNLDKPRGITSRQAVSAAQRILGVKKAGHAGTLDPMATGVLLICLGEATKISRLLMEGDKSYRAVMKLGERTDTLDADGTVIETRAWESVSPELLSEVVDLFTGSIAQKPPMYSAVKVEGQRLYRLARRGIEAERKERVVNIVSLKIENISFPFVTLEVVCSKGTYIRTLCDDIGLRLGCGAHLTALERTRSGMYNLQDAQRLSDIRADNVHIVSVADALRSRPVVRVCGDIEQRVLHGCAVKVADYCGTSDVEDVAVFGEGERVLGIGSLAGGVLKILRILNLPF